MKKFWQKTSLICLNFQFKSINKEHKMGNIVEAGGFGDTRVPSDDEDDYDDEL